MVLCSGPVPTAVSAEVNRMLLLGATARLVAEPAVCHAATGRVPAESDWPPMSTKNGRLVGMALAAISASCDSGPPDLCKDSSPACSNNVARYCETIKDCDSCSYHAQIIPQDCTQLSSTVGVAKICEIGSGKMAGAALCVECQYD